MAYLSVWVLRGSPLTLSYTTFSSLDGKVDVLNECSIKGGLVKLKAIYGPVNCITKMRDVSHVANRNSPDIK